ncbi:uncharacterized protein LOC128958342 isoform X2 [Oppia nitens]|uniref:uncharacterized protein LOC128958342 isoform X2 n=1 Tax=Oppia nitens TaxID=1686743 RepID=UPI0023DAA080|nr:uncharacterized protein LOC128958342 isoform X2 [Oppia nitens]
MASPLSSCLLLDTTSAADSSSHDLTLRSLPSLSLNAGNRCQSSVPPKSPNNCLSVRDFERILEELKSENFSLKLRIYFLEKSNQNSNPSDDVIRRLKRDLNATKQLARELANHLSRFVQSVQSNDSRLPHHLIDASEDLLNCASVLVTPANDVTTEQPIGRPIADEDDESDDVWSEPDREASRVRIGLSVGTELDAGIDKKLRSRDRKRPVGHVTSSLGVLNLDEDWRAVAVEATTQTSSRTTPERRADDKCCQTNESPIYPHNDLSAHKDNDQRSPKASSASLFTYRASLSPMSRRTREQNAKFVPNIASSETSQNSSQRPESDDCPPDPRPLSPDLGVVLPNGSSGEESVVHLSRRLWRRLRHLLSQIRQLSTSNAILTNLAKDALQLVSDAVIGRTGTAREDALWAHVERLRRSRARLEAAVGREVTKAEELLAKTAQELQ